METRWVSRRHTAAHSSQRVVRWGHWNQADWLVLVVVTGLLVPALSWAEDDGAPGAPGSGKGAKPGAAAAPAPDQPAKAPARRSLGDTAPADKAEPAQEPKYEYATFGAGCFWHVEAEFERLPGVRQAVSGYAGGMVPFPSYEMVHTGRTGHAEAVMVEFDPNKISYEKLLKVFWSIHDPTSLNQQGPDIGTQYRSVIFYHNQVQRRAALKSYDALNAARAFPRPIVTQLVPMRAFYRAEDYHQDYYGGPRKQKATTTHAKKTHSKAASSAHRARPARPQAEPDAIFLAPDEPASAKDPFASALDQASKAKP
jgi:peptide-methionine (S)-S-oxide reductase